jgi:D-3-phosphoglycerate dehydrogenase
MFKILMTYKSSEGLEALLSNKNFVVDVHPNPDAETFKKLIADADGLLIRSEVKVTREVFNEAKKLKLVARAGTGVDNVDIAAATQKGVAVMNVPGGNTIAAAEHTMALMLALARNIPAAHASLKAHKWEREKFIGAELPGKTLGLVGFGRIAREVAVRAKSFGMKILVYDPFVAGDFAKSMDAQSAASIDEVLKASDIVSLHLPLNDSTRNLINKAALSVMKKGACIINAARGPIVNEKDLAEAVSSGRIRAAVDVFAKEPPEDFTLIDAADVVTPHLGASTQEAQIKIAREIAECVADFFQKGAIRNALNLPALDAESFGSMKPYLDLAENIGRFIFQTGDGTARKIFVECAGSLPERSQYFITLAFLKGFLSPSMDEPVSYVNAMSVARSRGAEVMESSPGSAGGYHALVTFRIQSASGREMSVGGTVFADHIAKIVRVNGLAVDVAPSGCMLFLTNIDRAGIIGRIGTLLGDRGINIAGMDVARRNVGGEALTFVNIDACPERDILGAISSIEGVKQVSYVEF